MKLGKGHVKTFIKLSNIHFKKREDSEEEKLYHGVHDDKDDRVPDDHSLTEL